MLGFAMAGLCVYSLLALKLRYRLALFSGLLIHIVFFCLGAVLLWRHDVRQQKNWLGSMSDPPSYITVRLEEIPLQKTRSWKAVARVECSSSGTEWQPVNGMLLLYFAQQPVPSLSCGSRIVVRKALQPVPDLHNPGGFNFQRYCLFQGITHQVYLKQHEFAVVREKHKASLQSLVLEAQDRIIHLLRTYIIGSKEQGLAEALLIGYKNDLDRELVQAYTHTGVVHIIAISGMHLALIYGLLMGMTHPLRGKRWRVLRLLLILGGLWGFSLLAGAQASVVRSTVMFSCIALGELLERKIPVYNSLALSAFLLLCYDPFWLWDVGFQLSYTAVLSIVIFYQPIYRLCFWTNGLLDGIWKSMAVSLAAQILTTPVSLYHFHQFPVLFLLTNLVAVPLSSLVLMGEIAVCAFGWMSGPASVIGRLTTWAMQCMNGYIERLDRTSFAVWEGFSLSFVQMCLLLAAIAALHYWLTEKKKEGFVLALLSLLGFTIWRTQDFLQALQQKKLVVYAIPHHSAIDLIAGRSSCLVGDEEMNKENARAFYLQPARTLMRFRERQRMSMETGMLVFCGKTILLVRGKPPPLPACNIDLVVVSGRSYDDPSGWLERCSIKRLVIDGSVPAGAALRWKKAAAEHQVDCHDVGQKGAFVMNL